MEKILWIILASLAFSVSLKSEKLPSFLKICHRNDENLNNCIQESIEILRPKFNGGIAELFIPPCEPLRITEFELEQSSGPIAINSRYTDIEVYGLSDFVLRGVKIDVERDRFRMKLWFPNLRMLAKYSISGRIMVMPLSGEGNCSGNFSDVDVSAFILTEKVNRDEDVFFKIKDVSVKFNVGGSSVKLDNLFNGDADLGAAMNKFLNDNWKTVAAEIRPAMEHAIAEILEETSSKMFNTFSLNQLFPE